ATRDCRPGPSITPRIRPRWKPSRRTFPLRIQEIRDQLPAGTPLEIWFEDEARIGQKNKITRRWARRGTRPSAPKDQRTKWANITLLPLPSKAPELNPVENLWQFMRDNYLSNRVFQNYDDIVDHCCAAWNKISQQPWRIMSIGLRDWAQGY